MTPEQRAIDAAFIRLLKALDAECERYYRRLRAIHRAESGLLIKVWGDHVGGDTHPRAHALYDKSRENGGLHYELLSLHERWRKRQYGGSS